MIVCNSNINMEQLSEIELKRPERAGRVWTGIQHGELAEAIHDEVNLRGWKITDSRFSLSKDKAGLAGAFELDIPDIKPPTDQKLCLGFLTSNDCRRALRIVIGTRVLVCHNGMATGELLMNKKHTINFDLYDGLEQALDTYEERAREIPKLVEAMRARNLTQDESDRILMTAGRQGVMSWSRIGQVETEYRRPTFADHDERSSFGLLQAFTHIVKKSPPLTQMDQMNQFRELLPVHGNVSVN